MTPLLETVCTPATTLPQKAKYRVIQNSVHADFEYWNQVPYAVAPPYPSVMMA